MFLKIYTNNAKLISICKVELSKWNFFSSTIGMALYIYKKHTYKYIESKKTSQCQAML